MFLLPYQTTPCSAYVLTGIVSALQHAAIDGQLVAAQTGKNVPIEGLFVVPPYVKAVAPFAHPLRIEVSGKSMLVLDARAFTREDRINDQLRITNPNEYEFLTLRGRLTQAWTQGYESDLQSVGVIVPQVYTRLISEGIVRRLGLNPMDQQYLAVVTAFYYACLFTDEASLQEHDVAKYAARISRITNINTIAVLQILDQLKGEDQELRVLSNIESLVEAIRKVGSSPRLEALNAGLLIQAVGGVWFGANAREMVAVSLEYPPYFIALIYMALTDRTFHGAPLSKLVEQLNKRDAGKDFVRNLANFLEMTSHA
jgi:hypothetical protein